MKLHPEDPRLTAYLLGELDAAESAEVEQAIAADPALEAALDEIQVVGKILEETLAARRDELTPLRRSAVFEAARQADCLGKHAGFTFAGGSWKTWGIPLAAAAVAVIAFLVFSESPDAPKPTPVVLAAPESSPPPPANVPRVVMPAVLEKPLALERVATPFPTTRSGEFSTVADVPVLELPVLSGKPALDWITQAIQLEHRLPARESVRIEEILNSFPIRLDGMTAIARSPKPGWHPDTRDAGITRHAASLATETIACPWKPSATLLLVSIRGNASDECRARVVFRPDATTVFRHRLLGFAAGDATPPGEIPTRLSAGAVTTHAIEIEPLASSGSLGSIEWTVDDQAAPPVVIHRNLEKEPSNDARFASLLCAYGLWLAGDHAGIIDADLLAALAREVTTVDLDPERAGFLKLIDQSLNL